MKWRMYWTPFFLPWFFRGRKWRCDSNEAVYLTFDDGPHPEITPWLIDYANEQSIKLNFFWLGKNVAQFPTMLHTAIQNGHRVANHGYTHLNSFKVKDSDYLENVVKGQDIMPHRLFRPPYGRLSWRLAKKVKPISPIVMWTFLSYDWDKNVSNETIINALKKKLKPGAILVFHESDKTQERIKELIPKVIDVIKARGLKMDLLPL